MIVAMPFLLVLKAMFGSFLGGVGGFFKSAKGVIITFLVLSILIGGGWLYNKHMNRVDKKAETIQQVAVAAAEQTQEVTKTLQMSHQIDLSHLEKDAKTVTVIGQKADTVKQDTKKKVTAIKKKADADVVVAATPEERQVIEAKASEEISLARMNSVWKTYCNALTPTGEANPSCAAHV